MTDRDRPDTDPLIAGQTPLSAVPEADARHTDKDMTEKQAVQLRELTEKLGEPFDASLTRAQAARRIAALKEMLG